MPAPSLLPTKLNGRAFTTQRARDVGITAQELRGRRFTRIHRGVYRYAETPATPELLIAAARLLLPEDAALSHTTALWWHGVDLRKPTPLHFSTNSSTQSQLDGVVLHRRRGELPSAMVRWVPTLHADRTFIDCATMLGTVDLVRAGDWLIRLGLISRDLMREYAQHVHIDGVIRARRAIRLMRDRVESVRETDVRLMLKFAHLPEPDINLPIVDERGEFLARGDMPYRRFKVLVEYDGWQHERDANQRQKDHLRREQLEAVGWLMIVVTVADLQQPVTVVRRVYDALRSRGYAGPPPVMSDVWKRWFLPRNL